MKIKNEEICAGCGLPISAGSPEGICPACLLKRGFDTQTADGQPAAAGFTPPTPEKLAAQFPGLDILELLGRGGMGVVYKARQRDLNRIVALKILPAAGERDPAFAERFAREARTLAQLNHPNIVAVYDSGQTGGLFYFIMEYVDGLNLHQVMQAAKLAPAEALAIVPQLCDALQYAHDQGIVHRDIKPENILLDKNGRVKIADFGLAKIMARDPTNLTLTGKGEVMGTPIYMAPEQIERPQQVDHRADIYSLGVVFYQMLTGELPLGRFAPPSARMRGIQIDVRLDDVVLRALEKEPERRYQQVSEVKTQMKTIEAANGATETKPQEGNTRGAPATPIPIPRAAIAGAVWAFLFFLSLVILLFFGAFTFGSPLNSIALNPLEILRLDKLPLLLAPIAAAPFGTTLLGLVAMSQIRRAAGTLQGMGLAVFDVLLFPLLALNGGIVAAFVSANVWLGQSAIPLAMFVVGIADYFIIRRVLDMITKPAGVNNEVAIGLQKLVRRFLWTFVFGCTFLGVITFIIWRRDAANNKVLSDKMETLIRQADPRAKQNP